MPQLICPHCKVPYDDLGDAFCPNCHEEVLGNSATVNDEEVGGDGADENVFSGRIEIRPDSLGEKIYDCRTIRSKKSLRQSTVLGAVLISLVVIVLVSCIASMAIVNHFDKLYPHLGMVLIVVHLVVAVLVLPLVIYRAIKKPLVSQFILYENGIKYGYNCWSLDAIVAVKRGIAGKFGTVANSTAKIAKLVSPGKAAVLEGHEKSAIHLVFANNQTTTLFGAFDVFEPSDVKVLIVKMRKIRPEIKNEV